MKDDITQEIEDIFKECQLKGKVIEERRYPNGRKTAISKYKNIGKD